MEASQSPEVKERRRTKIVATIGPASRDPNVLSALIEAGADVLRLNFSHASEDEHAENVRRIRDVAEQAGREVGILGDLPGPKIRLGDLGERLLALAEGDQVVLAADGEGEEAGTSTERQGETRLHRVPVGWPRLSEAVSPGDSIYLADGRIRLEVLEATPGAVRCEVEVGGRIGSHQGINLPGADSAIPAAGPADMDWVDWACEHEVDLLALSFVRRPADLNPVKQRLEERGIDIPLIAKIEKPQAAESADEITEAADSGIMVARGDLGIELPIASVPIAQKRLIRTAGLLSKPAITATQMLASMVSSDRPTRAEVTDVANAIFDGTDAVMLSEETAIGQYPVEAVRVLDRIAKETEPELPYGDWLLHRIAESDDVGSSVAQGAVGATYRLGLAAIVVPTTTGRTARLVSALRPRVPVLALSSNRATVRRLNLLFGVVPAHAPERDSLRELLDDCARIARDQGVAASGDLVAITAGLPEQHLGTNLFEVHRVP